MLNTSWNRKSGFVWQRVDNKHVCTAENFRIIMKSALSLNCCIKAVGASQDSCSFLSSLQTVKQFANGQAVCKRLSCLQTLLKYNASFDDFG
jgi:hypothetical protein